MTRLEKIDKLVKQIGVSYQTDFIEIKADGVYSDGFLYLRVIKSIDKNVLIGTEVDTLKSIYNMIESTCKEKGVDCDVVEENYGAEIPYIVYT